MGSRQGDLYWNYFASQLTISRFTILGRLNPNSLPYHYTLSTQKGGFCCFKCVSSIFTFPGITIYRCYYNNNPACTKHLHLRRYEHKWLFLISKASSIFTWNGMGGSRQQPVVGDSLLLIISDPISYFSTEYNYLILVVGCCLLMNNAGRLPH